MKRQSFLLFCKTYAGDYNAFTRLFNSINKYNRDNINLVVSCPYTDMDIFKKFSAEGVVVISDESYAEKYLVDNEIRGLSKGYINQEICKLAFSETEMADNYLCLDSDAIFIRDFQISDFMFDEHTPYSVLSMDKDLACEKEYQHYWDFREKEIRKIFDFLDYKSSTYKTCHGFQILNSSVVAKLKSYCGDKGFDFSDMIEYSPFEFTWYNVALQKFDVIPVIEVEPLFKCFHYKNQYLDAKRNCMGINDWARQYVGIVMNSNWSRSNEGYCNPTGFDKLIFKIRCRLFSR